MLSKLSTERACLTAHIHDFTIMFTRNAAGVAAASLLIHRRRQPPPPPLGVPMLRPAARYCQSHTSLSLSGEPLRFAAAFSSEVSVIFIFIR